MADIDVVKKRSPTWIWVLVAIALVVVLWMVLGQRSGADTVGRTALPSSADQVIDRGASIRVLQV